jgi:hypothetical protein
MTLTITNGTFTVTNKNERSSGSFSGTVATHDDSVEFTLENGEHFVMRWTVDGNSLTLRRDESLGIAPTPMVIKMWSRTP